MRTYNSRQISTHTHAHTCTHINAAHVCSRVACPYRHLRIRYEYYTWPSIVPYIPWPTRSRLDSCAKRNERGALLAVEVREIGRGGAAVGWGREIQLHLVEVHGDMAHRVHTYTPRHGRVYTRLVDRCACVPQRRRVVDPTAHSALHVFQTTQNTTCLGNALQAVSNLI